MDDFSFTCVTPEVKRLKSFQRMPLPNQQKLSISNSPAKLARAGFMRQTHASDDEVCCESCGIIFAEWAGESPFAVHRVLSENCPFLTTTTSAADDILRHPRVTHARRQLFPHGEAIRNTEDGEFDGTVGNSFDHAGENTRSEGNDEAENNAVETSENNPGDSDSDIENTEQDSDNSSHSVPMPSHSQVLHNSSPPQSTFVSVMSPQASFTFPFKPPVGGFDMLFASRRLKTFSDSGCPECVEWAEEGFIFRSTTSDVQCVFCAVILPFHTCEEPKYTHAEKSIQCPRVLMVDVGNISSVEEERIKLKNLQRQLKTKGSPDRHYTICYPQFEEESKRLGTYDNWPHGSWDDRLQATVMSQAGFYFTGCADKVKCFCCGVGVYRWRQGSDPWEQHARHMPTCPHLLVKGHHFVQQAAQIQVLTEADLSNCIADSGSPESSPGSADQLVTSPPGSLTLDVCAVTAALSTSQYTPQQVRHAVLTFFCHTSRFPTKDILLGTLKAADENFTTVCQQRETIYQKDTVIQQTYTALQQKDTVIQQTYTALQQKDTVIQQTYTALQQKDTALQQKDTALQQKDTALQQQNQIIQQHQQELFLRQEELQAKEEELERKRRQMSYQESQITSLRIQMQALIADRQQAGLQAAPLQAPPAAAPNNDAGDSAIMCDIRCKVCLSAESDTILRPCHHITCCSHCAHQLFNNSCPVCRASIDDILPAFIS